MTLGTAPADNAGNITGPANTFNANTATYIKVAAPGLLSGFRDASGYRLSVVPTSVSISGATVVADA